MKIIKKEYEELITNYEVLSLLKHKRRIEGQVILNEFINNTVKYLESTPASKESTESVKKCKFAVNKLAHHSNSKIMKGELLQILNIAPSGEVEVHLIVEDCEDRFNPKELLKVVKESLGDAVVRENI